MYSISEFIEHALKRKNVVASFQFQPDQIGEVIWAISEYQKRCKKIDFSELIEKLADGIVRFWNKNHFVLPTKDIWEEEMIYPRDHSYFPVTLGFCALGLRKAMEYLGEKRRWLSCYNEMIYLINKAFDRNRGFIYKVFGKRKCKKIDSSSLFLICGLAKFSMKRTQRNSQKR